VPSASEVTPVWHRSYLNLIQLLNLITVRLPLNNFSFFGSTLSVRNLGQLYRTRCCAGIVQILSSLEHHSICEYFHQLFISKALHEDHSSNMFHSGFSHIRSGRKTGVGRPGKRAEHLESARSALLGVWSEGSSEFEGPKNPLVRRFGGDPEASTFLSLLTFNKRSKFPTFSSLLYNIINTYTCIRGLFLSNLDYTVVR